MKSTKSNTQTFRDKLYASVEQHQYAEVAALINASVCGSDRIEGIYRPRISYEVESPDALPRRPREER